MKLNDSISAIVTGGASGLGAATARALAAKGVKVAIFDLQAGKGESVAAEIGGVFCEVNVTDDASVDAGFAKARAANGQERVLLTAREPAMRSRPPAGQRKTAASSISRSTRSTGSSRSIWSVRSAASRNRPPVC